MDNFWNSIVAVATAIVGLGIIATLVSRNANTAGVITAAATGFSGALTAAEGPVLSGGGGFGGIGGFGGMTLMGAPQGY